MRYGWGDFSMEPIMEKYCGALVYLCCVLLIPLTVVGEENKEGKYSLVHKARCRCHDPDILFHDFLGTAAGEGETRREAVRNAVAHCPRPGDWRDFISGVDGVGVRSCSEGTEAVVSPDRALIPIPLVEIKKIDPYGWFLKTVNAAVYLMSFANSGRVRVGGHGIEYYVIYRAERVAALCSEGVAEAHDLFFRDVFFVRNPIIPQNSMFQSALSAYFAEPAYALSDICQAMEEQKTAKPLFVGFFADYYSDLSKVTDAFGRQQPAHAILLRSPLRE